MEKFLKDKVAIVTGVGKFRGIGRATALKLASYGANVVITGLDDKGQSIVRNEMVNEIEKHGGKALNVPVDVTDRAQIDACVQKTLDTFGRIDIMFNNAGTALGCGKFLEIEKAKWEKTFAVNVIGMAEFCQAVIPTMIEQKSGAIINNSSMSGLGVIAGTSAYNASKFAVIGLTRTLAIEYGMHGIRANAICPGLTQTDMGDLEIVLFKDWFKLDSMKAAEEFALEPVALGRWGQPDDIADAVCWLASEEASYVTGVSLPIAGGMGMGW